MSDEAKDSQATDQVKEGESPQPAKVNYLGREMTADELLEEAKKKDAYITQRDQELAELRKTSEETQSGAEVNDPAQEFELKQARKMLGLPEDGSLDEYIEKKLSQRDAQRTVDQSMRELSQKYNGKGDMEDYPVFKDTDVAQYAYENGFSNLDAAYRDMHRDKILAVEIDKANQKAKKPSAAPDASDAPRVEPTDKDALAKKFSPEVLRDPQKFAQALQETGMGALPK